MRVVLILGVAFASACASFPPPNDTLAQSVASVRGAEEVGAADVPQAALSLQLAREEVAKAKALLAEGENERAYYMALRAANDAELANALARENHAASEAKRADAEAKAAARPNP
jgi:hypothetical protein